MELLGWPLAELLPFFAIGLVAQAIDGALGMAFGVITTTSMVGLLGVPPALASARVHIVECFTTAASAISHLLHGNIERGLFLRLIIPGIIGGVLGAYVLSNIDGDAIKPFVLGYLAIMGVWLLVRGLFYPPRLRKPPVVEPLALAGGFLDAAGGGGWGPVVTTNLLVQGGEPRKVIGSVNSAEFFITLTVSATFISQLGFADLTGPTLALLAGGLVAAPFGAFVAKRVAVKPLLIMVGVVLTATSLFSLWRALIAG